MPGVEAGAARAEAVAARRGDRPQEPQRRARRRPPQRRQRGRPGDAVRRQPGPLLEPDERGGRARAEPAVDRPAREPVAREQELQRGDVPPARGRHDRARAQPWPPAPPQRAPRARPRDAVHGDARPRLEPPHRRPRQRAADAVHVTAVEALGAQRDLEGRHVRGDAGLRGGSRAQQESRESGQGDPCHPANSNSAPSRGLRLGAMLQRVRDRARGPGTPWSAARTRRAAS